MALVELSFCHKCQETANKVNGVLRCQVCESNKYNKELNDYIKSVEKMRLEDRIATLEREKFDLAYNKKLNR